MKLSRRSNLLLALVCLAGIAQQWLADGTAGWWRYGAALLVAGLWYEWFSVRAAAFSVSTAARIKLRLGREQTVTLHFANGDDVLREVEFFAAPPADISCARPSRHLRMAPRELLPVELALTAHEIGQREWRSLSVRMRGPLGLAWWPLNPRLDAQLSCAPDLRGDWRRLPGGQPRGDRAERPGTGMELHHLRPYAPGDPLKTIHWKASARSQSLVTRVMSEEQRLDIVLVVDIGRTSRTRVDGMSQFGHYLNLAASFSSFANANGDAVGLVAVAGKPLLALPPRRGAAAQMALHRALGSLQPAAEETDLLAAALEVQRLTSKRSLVVLVTDLYSQVLSGSFGRSLQLWRTRHLACVVGLLGDEVDQLAGRDAVSARDAYLSLAAAEYRRGLEANAAAARRLGARALVARPADLQARVLEEYFRLKARRVV